MDIMKGNAMARKWCESNEAWRLSEIMLETGMVRSNVPDDMRQAIKTTYAESVEAGGKEETGIFGRGAWRSMKAKASVMKGWWVEKGTGRMEVRRVYRRAGKWYVMGYAPKARTRRCAPSTRLVWWKVKACNRHGGNTVETGGVRQSATEDDTKESWRAMTIG
jgi:hypothetical protein